MPGRAYTQQQREQVTALLEAGRDEISIEKETGVTDRTIRRWKMELERTGQIGKPPEARTGRNRVLSSEMELALIDFHKKNPDASVDDMLWWLWESHKLVVGVRTIRRVFERNPESKPPRKSKSKAKDAVDDSTLTAPEEEIPSQPEFTYSSPYGAMNSQTTAAAAVEQQLTQALQLAESQTNLARELDLSAPLPDDEETVQLQLQQVVLQKREVELRLKLRRLQEYQAFAPTSQHPAKRAKIASTLYDPSIAVPATPRRDSRSKKKIAESKERTAQRQERMLRDLERRSRRREHLTAEWVQSKDIWPLRAQGLLADVMHSHNCYTFDQGQNEAFENMYLELYQLVDHSTGDWDPSVHDDMLRERMKRKMIQLRAKMQKLGEIVPRTDGYQGFQRAENYTGEQARDAVGGDESEIGVSEIQEQQQQQQHQGHPGGNGAPGMHQQDPTAVYQPMPPEHHHHHHDEMQADEMSTYAHQAILNSQAAPQYPMLDQHGSLLPYGPMGQGGGMVL